MNKQEIIATAKNYKFDPMILPYVEAWVESLKEKYGPYKFSNWQVWMAPDLNRANILALRIEYKNPFGELMNFSARCTSDYANVDMKIICQNITYKHFAQKSGVHLNRTWMGYQNEVLYLQLVKSVAEEILT